MKIYTPNDPGYSDMRKAMNRRAMPDHALLESVNSIITDVRERGDAALFELTQKFDNVSLTDETIKVSRKEFDDCDAQVSEGLKKAIAASLENITYFAEQSRRRDWMGVNAQGVEVGERFLPYNRVGLYIPGGKAPLVSTSLMTGGFARAIGVPEIVAATPCGPDGKINPAVLYALKQVGVSEIIKVGGAQAIAALALGSESVGAVDKIFGPGNKFVVEAKRQLVGAVSIDLLPGPSEVMVLADETADAEFLAADLLAQAEHGPDSIVAFVTNSATLLEKVGAEVERQAFLLSRGEIIRHVLEEYAYGILVADLEDAVKTANDFAPEHIVVMVDGEKEDEVLAGITTAGAIYAGSYSTVACGDFLAGPSHTLPTGGAGKSFSGLRADQFQRRTSIVKMSPESAINSMPYVHEFAIAEGLDAHGHSMQVRFDRATASKVSNRE